MTPFELVYGVEAQLCLSLELSTLNLQKIIEDGVFSTTIEKWVLYLQKIEEERREIMNHITSHQARLKNIFWSFHSVFSGFIAFFEFLARWFKNLLLSFGKATFLA